MKYLIACWVFLSLLGCKKEDVSFINKNYLISEIIYSAGSTAIKVQFVYNGDFLIDTVKKFSNDALIGIYCFDYIGNKPSVILDDKSESTWNFDYDTVYQHTTIYCDSNFAFPLRIYSFDNSGHLTDIATPGNSRSFSLTYDEVGNIQYMTTNDIHPTNTGIEYDDHFNYRKLLKFPYNISYAKMYEDPCSEMEFLVSDIELNSDNNITAIHSGNVWSQQDLVWKNLYDKEKKLIKIEVSHGGQNYIMYTKEFRYVKIN